MVGVFCAERYMLRLTCLFLLLFAIGCVSQQKKSSMHANAAPIAVRKEAKTSKAKPSENKRNVSAGKRKAPKKRFDESKDLGSNLCVRCHPDRADIRKSAHRKVFDKDHGSRGCEKCHGRGSAHANSPRTGGIIKAFSKLGVEELDAECLECHKQKRFKLWRDSNAHARGTGAPCSLCHRVHSTRKDYFLVMYEPALCFKCHKKTEVSFKGKYSHPIESGRVICKNCHGVHEKNYISNNERNAVVVCSGCHKITIMNETFPHAPVMRSCTNCHAPHGSDIPGQLKRKMPDLCVACHDIKQHKAPTDKKDGKSCISCHDYIHGGFNRLLSSTIMK